MIDRRLARYATAIVTALFISACGSDSTGPDDPGTPPPLPPLSSMNLDLSYFGGSGGSGLATHGLTAPDLAAPGLAAPGLAAPGLAAPGLTVDGSGAAGPHFVQGALRVLVAEVIAVAVLAIPTATFGAALQAGHTWEDGVWHWQANAAAAGGTWTADLTGTIQGADALWEMRLTSPESHTPRLEDFLWYSGASRLDGSSGVWRIFDGLQGEGNEVLRLDWTHTSETQHSLTITVTRPGGQDTGDSIVYDVDGPLRTIVIHDASQGTTTEIGWNAETGAGYIIAPGYNGGLKACWDSAQNDVACAA